MVLSFAINVQSGCNSYITSCKSDHNADNRSTGRDYDLFLVEYNDMNLELDCFKSDVDTTSDFPNG